jgi:DNA-binding FadR family transcriptional regulator
MHGQIVNEIGRMIVQASRNSAVSLPTEPELCQLFGVSRGAVREAVKSLVGKGMIDVRPRLGTRVRSRREWNMFDPAVLQWILEDDDEPQLLEDFAQLREAVEVSAAARAAIRADPEEMATLWREFIAMEAAANSGDRMSFVAADARFHQQLLFASGNEFFASLGKVVEVALQSFLEASSIDHTSVLDSVALHRALVVAISAHDAAASADAALSLISAAARALSVAPLRISLGDSLHT